MIGTWQKIFLACYIVLASGVLFTLYSVSDDLRRVSTSFLVAGTIAAVWMAIYGLICMKESKQIDDHKLSLWASLKGVAWILAIPIAWFLIGGQYTLIYIKQASHLIDYMDSPRFYKVENDVAKWTGSFSTGSGDGFLFFLAKHPEIKTIELDSTGGKTTEGYKLAAGVRELRLNTLVKNECSSACTFAFFSGFERTLEDGGKIGLHMTDHKTTIESKVAAERDAFIKNYADAGLSREFIEEIMNIPSDKIWYVDRARLNEENLL